MWADTLVLGGRIRPRASAATASHLAIRDGGVTAVGGPEVLDQRGPRTEVIDLEGATLLPGFHDAHAHVVYEGLMRAGLDLRPPNIASIADITRLVRERAAALPAATWVTGHGLTDSALAEGRLPERTELDAAAPDHPVVLDRLDGHIRVVNQAALHRAGISGATPDPPGGRIDRDAAGEPTGILRDTAMRLVADAMPAPSLAQRKAGVAAVLEAGLRRGVTSVTAAVGRGFGDDVRTFAELAASGELEVRLTMMLARDHLDAAVAAGLRSGFGDRWVRYGPVKLFVDGNFPAQTAMLSSAPDRGLWRTPPEELRAVVSEAHVHGWAVALHAVGDLAVQAALDAVEAAVSRYGRRALSHRIEHGTVCPPEQQRRAGALGVAFCVQPAVLRFSGRQRLAPLTAAQWPYVMPYRSLAAAGVTLALSSDAPFGASASPLTAIAAAVDRQTHLGEPFNLSEALSLEAAWRGYTRGGAAAAGEQGWKGTLEPGQVADFVAFREDPWEVPLARLDALRPALVGVAGRVRYRAP